jgi:hypothetical protein
MNEELFREATAFVPQSTIGDHALGAVQPELGIEGGVLTIWKWSQKHKDIKVVLTAHDSVILEIPKDMEREVLGIIKPMFMRPMVIHGEEFTVPVDTKCGELFGELEEMKVA